MARSPRHQPSQPDDPKVTVVVELLEEANDTAPLSDDQDWNTYPDGIFVGLIV